jgi:GntR family transcriptional regulator, carbon starvation induced regulator
MKEHSQQRTLAGTAYQALRHDIVTGVLQPLAKLKLEDLRTRYGLGFAPLREALARLVGECLVVAEDQRGFWVAPLSLQELRDVTRLRTLIEVEALQDAMRLGKADWEDGVRAAFAALSSVEQEILSSDQGLMVPQFDRWEVCNERFHSALIAACGSPTFLEIRAALYHRAERYRRVVQTFDREAHEEHVALFEAVIDRNVLRACRYTEIHIRRRTEGVLRRAATAMISQ